MIDRRDNIIEFAEEVLGVDISLAHKLIMERLAIDPAIQVDGIDRRTAKQMIYNPDYSFEVWMPPFTFPKAEHQLMLQRTCVAFVGGHDDALDALLHGYFSAEEFSLTIGHLATLTLWRAVVVIRRIRWRQMARHSRAQWAEFRRSCKQTRLETSGWRPVPGGHSWFIEDDMELL